MRPLSPERSPQGGWLSWPEPTWTCAESYAMSRCALNKKGLPVRRGVLNKDPRLFSAGCQPMRGRQRCELDVYSTSCPLVSQGARSRLTRPHRQVACCTLFLPTDDIAGRRCPVWQRECITAVVRRADKEALGRLAPFFFGSACSSSPRRFVMVRCAAAQPPDITTASCKGLRMVRGGAIDRNGQRDGGPGALGSLVRTQAPQVVPQACFRRQRSADTEPSLVDVERRKLVRNPLCGRDAGRVHPMAPLSGV